MRVVFAVSVGILRDAASSETVCAAVRTILSFWRGRHGNSVEWAYHLYDGDRAGKSSAVLRDVSLGSLAADLAAWTLPPSLVSSTSHTDRAAFGGLVSGLRAALSDFFWVEADDVLTSRGDLRHRLYILADAPRSLQDLVYFVDGTFSRLASQRLPLPSDASLLHAYSRQLLDSVCSSSNGLRRMYAERGIGVHWISSSIPPSLPPAPPILTRHAFDRNEHGAVAAERFCVFLGGSRLSLEAAATGASLLPIETLLRSHVQSHYARVGGGGILVSDDVSSFLASPHLPVARARSTPPAPMSVLAELEVDGAALRLLNMIEGDTIMPPEFDLLSSAQWSLKGGVPRGAVEDSSLVGPPMYAVAYEPLFSVIQSIHIRHCLAVLVDSARVGCVLLVAPMTEDVFVVRLARPSDGGAVCEHATEANPQASAVIMSTIDTIGTAARKNNDENDAGLYGVASLQHILDDRGLSESALMSSVISADEHLVSLAYERAQARLQAAEAAAAAARAARDAELSLKASSITLTGQRQLAELLLSERINLRLHGPDTSLSRIVTDDIPEMDAMFEMLPRNVVGDAPEALLKSFLQPPTEHVADNALRSKVLRVQALLRFELLVRMFVSLSPAAQEVITPRLFRAASSPVKSMPLAKRRAVLSEEKELRLIQAADELYDFLARISIDSESGSLRAFMDRVVFECFQGSDLVPLLRQVYIAFALHNSSKISLPSSPTKPTLSSSRPRVSASQAVSADSPAAIASAAVGGGNSSQRADLGPPDELLGTRSFLRSSRRLLVHVPRTSAASRAGTENATPSMVTRAIRRRAKTRGPQFASSISSRSSDKSYQDALMQPFSNQYYDSSP